MRGVWMLGAALLVFVTHAEGKGFNCPDGQFQIDVVGRRAALEPGQAIALDSHTVALPGRCPPAPAPERFTDLPDHWFLGVKATWDACADTRVRGIRARFGPTCTRLDGAFLLGRGRKVRFRSTRVAACGDGLVQAPEACDAPGDPCCTSDCRVVAGCSGPCPTDADCAAVAYCDWGSTCGETRGECRIPNGGLFPCDGDAPVCGCDGITYPDRCEASAVGVPFRYFGACGTRCQLDDPGFACPDDLFCDVPGWRCDQKPQGSFGNCVSVPDDPATCVPYNPIRVCGCDGVVYQNDCYRLAARVQWEACEQ